MSRPRRTAHEKIVSVNDLLRALRPLRAAGSTVVFTNGCYDLLHAGHLHLLESAAALGEILVVGLNGDDSIRRLKGALRPLMAFEERAMLLGAFDVVDWVVRFDEETPAELIRAVEPDVLVKGGDWPPDTIVGRETVEARGGRVIAIPLQPGHSTTLLVERIRSSPR